MDNKEIEYLKDENGNPIYCRHVPCNKYATCYIQDGRNPNKFYACYNDEQHKYNLGTIARTIYE